MSRFDFKFEAIGTKWQIEGFLPQGLTGEKLLSLIQNRISIFDKNYSRFRKDSLVYEMSKKRGVFSLPEDASKMLDLYFKLYEVTNGKFTPLIGPTLEQAGYDANYSFKKREIKRVLKWADVLDYKFPNLKIKIPTILDFGGIGKGYLIDIVAELLLKSQIEEFSIDAGGDIICFSEEELKVGLEHPGEETQVIGIASIKNQSICASSGNRRRWNEFHHIIDPDFLASPDNVLATWVVAKEAITADALATSLFLVPAKDLINAGFKFDYLILYPDYTFEKSDNFPGELFLK